MTMWTGAQEIVLRRMYANASREEIMEALPTHTWQAICVRAKDRGLKRAPRHVPHRHPLIQQLYQRRLDLSWSQTKAAGKIGIARTTLNRMEHGRCWPRFGVLEKWARVLGLEFGLSAVEIPAWTSGQIERVQESSAVAP